MGCETGVLDGCIFAKINIMHSCVRVRFTDDTSTGGCFFVWFLEFVGLTVFVNDEWIGN